MISNITICIWFTLALVLVTSIFYPKSILGINTNKLIKILGIISILAALLLYVFSMQ